MRFCGLKSFGAWLSCLLCSLSIIAQPQPPNNSTRKGVIRRKVLIFDFENQTGKPEFGYLAGSIADALVEPIKKTQKFQLLSRDNAKVATPDAANEKQKEAPLPPQEKLVTEKNEPGKPATATGMSETKPPILKQFNRTEAIRVGQGTGADVVVFGKFSELNGVLLLSAQAYETDTKLLKVSEEVLTKSDSDMFNGINVLAEKIADSMARELPMFDAVEAELRRAAIARQKAEERDWEIQLFSGIPIMQSLYSSDGTITYAKGIPVQNLTGYSLGAAVWESRLAKKIYFLPKGSRFGIQSKLTMLTGQADIVGQNSLLLTQAAPLSGVFVSNHLLFGFPYWQSGRFAAFAEFGAGALYSQLSAAGSAIFASWQPSALIGTSVAYQWPYWSLGLSYRAQVAMFSQNQAFLEHDFWLYAGVRL